MSKKIDAKEKNQSYPKTSITSPEATFAGELNIEDRARSYGELKNREWKQKTDHNSANKPLIIYIAETDHGDMSYSAFLKKTIEECESRNLKTQTFSEFKNQNEKLMSYAQNLSNVPAKEVHDATTEFLNQKLIPMGNLFNRFHRDIPRVWQSLPENITPSGILKERRGQIDNPEILILLEKEIEIRQENQKQGLENGNSKGKSEDGDAAKFWGNGNAFVQKSVHEEMAQDINKKRDIDTEIIIIVTGAAHIYGLNKQLESEFQDCNKLVVGNFVKFKEDLSTVDSIRKSQILGGKKSCQAVAEVVGFEFDITKEISIPDGVVSAISKHSEIINQSQKSTKKEVANATLISSISTKTGLTPNQLIEMYQNPENGKLNLKDLISDYNNGKGVKLIQDKQKEFSSEKTHEEMEGAELSSFVGRLNLSPTKPTSHTEKVLEKKAEESVNEH